MYSHQGVDRQVAAKQKRKELRTELKRNISIFKDRKTPKIFLVCNVCIGQSFFWLQNCEVHLLCTMLQYESLKIKFCLFDNNFFSL